MQINLYKNLSDNKEINKVKLDLGLVDAKLKESTSVRSPFLTLKINEDVIGDVNYLYIPKFSRYYYVNNKTSIATGLWQLECSVDVLESFKDEILSNSAIIERQENQYNINQQDNEFSVYSNPILETWKFNSFGDNEYYLITAQSASE